MSERPPGGMDEPLRPLLDGLPDCANFSTDPEGRVEDWNVGAELLLGYREEEIVDQPVSRMYTPENIERGESAKERLMAVAGRFSQDRRQIRKDGSHLWAGCVTTAVRDEAGGSRGFVDSSRIGRGSDSRKSPC